ncbi:MAG: hypothetical protein GY783_19905, partial [Gammaproteobacteria bacterium]|nr:hypothetical protein [Gammaproteobacteria bacterium]
MNHALIFSIALLMPALAFGETADRPSVPPEMSARKLSVAPLTDGNVLGDDAWSDAVPAREFWQVQPNDGQPSTQR